MKVNQLISDIRNIASSGSNPIEFKIEDAQILFWCNEIRSTLISQAIQKKQDISDVWIQWIHCLEMEQVDKSECCEIQTNCYILRSVQELPNTIETFGDNSIIRVMTPTGKIISKSTGFEAQWSYGKYTKEQPKWFIKNKRLYITNEEFIKWVDVALLAENPSDLAGFNNCAGTACFNSGSEYPCSLKMASDITNIVLKTKVYPFLQMPADNTNDNANTTQQPNIRNT